MEVDGTKASALDMLSLMARRCKPGEVFVFFFAGHGTSVVDVDGDEADGRDEALCFTRDGRMSRAENLIDDDLAATICSSFDPGVDVLLITDCCHSGTIGDLEKAIWKPFRAVSISACKDYQTSIDTGKGGALTALLLETLEDLVDTGEAPDFLSIAALEAAVLRSRHYAPFAKSQQVSFLHTARARKSPFGWPFVPKAGYSVDML